MRSVILAFESAAALSILLPYLLSGLTPGGAVLYLVLAAAAGCLLLGLFLRPVGSRWGAVIRCWAGYLFFLCTAAVFLRLAAELLGQYLWPGAPAALLCSILFVPCLLAAGRRGGNIAPRRRYPALGAGVTVAVGVSLYTGSRFSGVQAWDLPQFPVAEAIGAQWRADGLPLRGEPVCAALLLLGLLLLVADACSCIRLFGRSLCAEAVRLCDRAFAPDSAAPTDGTRNAPCTDPFRERFIPGGKAERGVFLTEFAQELSWSEKPQLTPEKKKSRRSLYMQEREGTRISDGIWGLSLALAFLLAAGFTGTLAAVSYYRAFALQTLAPVMLCVLLVLHARGQVRPAA